VEDTVSGTEPVTVRVVVADDQDIVRDGLVTVLTLIDGLEVVGAARDGEQAVELVATHRPDVVLMDLRMPGLDGAAATARLRQEFPEVAVLVLTTFDDDESIAAALSAGARGYLTKDASRTDIALAIRTVARGQSTFTAGVVDRLLGGLTRSAGAAHADRLADERLRGLTAREREVLSLIGDGLNNGEIADRLVVSATTVKTHINNLFAKLDLRDRAQAVRLARDLSSD
jgi:DNA-binding NarL/FixJ family response regulator